MLLVVLLNKVVNRKNTHTQTLFVYGSAIFVSLEVNSLFNYDFLFTKTQNAAYLNYSMGNYIQFIF